MRKTKVTSTLSLTFPFKFIAEFHSQFSIGVEGLLPFPLYRSDTNMSFHSIALIISQNTTTWEKVKTRETKEQENKVIQKVHDFFLSRWELFLMTNALSLVYETKIFEQLFNLMDWGLDAATNSICIWQEAAIHV